VYYELMDRPVQLKDSRVGSRYTVSGVAFNAADQPIQTQFAVASGNFWENRGYNQLNQLTTLNNFNTTGGAPNGPVQLSYTYASGANNGQITGSTEGGGATVSTFTYDALKRLTGASTTGGANWSQTYTYDGFGNMTAKTGSGQNFTVLVDPATNRLGGTNVCYDSNGNLVSDQNGGGCGNPNYSYDLSNRMVSARWAGGTEHYIYDADNKRISTIAANGSQTIYIYGAMGEKLSVLSLPLSIFGTTVSNNVYFAGRLIKQGTDIISANFDGGVDDNFVAVDRLGSLKKSYYAASTSFLPYGEEVNGTSNDQIKFATYTRDGSTGLDYADQRFYTSTFGRFMSADPSAVNISYSNSQSWNAYTYTLGDPTNGTDPTGLVTCGNLPVVGGGTVGSYFNTTSDAGLLTEFVWEEAGTLAANGTTDALQLSQFLIGQAIENRLAIANGLVNVTGKDGKNYPGGSTILGYGGIGTTLAQEIYRADGGAGAFNSSGQLINQSQLTSTLNTDLGDPTRNLPGRISVPGTDYFVTPECYSAISALQAVNSLLAGATLHTPGFFVTSWKQVGNSNPDPTRLFDFGSVGDTEFYGFGHYYYGPRIPIRRR
jgi:RHS repeat-associated protein